MIKTVLYIAASLDAYIAKPDGNLDWLTSFPVPSEDDYGYSKLLSNTETIIMGRKTYEEVIGFGIEWQYNGIETYIVSSNKNLKIQSPDTYVLSGNIKEFIADKKLQNTKDIWLVGGGELLKTFINEALLDKMHICIIPRIIGNGIRLFPAGIAETEWKLTETKAYETGAVMLTYDKII